MAEYKNKTISEIRDLITDSIQEKFNQSLKMLPKAFLRVTAAVFAGIFIVLYKQIGWLFLQLSPETANWGEASVLLRRVRPLVMWGRLIGVGDPKTGTQWRGTAIVKATGVPGTLIAGTQLKAEATGKLYITEESVPMSGTLKVAVPLICAESGEAGNLDPGDVLSFTAPLGIAEKTAEAGAVAESGADDETEAEYRARVVARFRSPPLGGALSDYRRWAADVPGVLNTYPYKEIETPSGVLRIVDTVNAALAAPTDADTPEPEGEPDTENTVLNVPVATRIHRKATKRKQSCYTPCQMPQQFLLTISFRHWYSLF
jgi:uncharacterized phage protein gp47/JayE